MWVLYWLLLPRTPLSTMKVVSYFKFFILSSANRFPSLKKQSHWSWRFLYFPDLILIFQRYIDSTKNLADVYEDRDESRRKEINAIGGPNEFAEFYSRLKALKDYHRRNPEEVAIPLSMEFQEVCEVFIVVNFDRFAEDSRDRKKTIGRKAKGTECMNKKTRTKKPLAF